MAHAARRWWLRNPFGLYHEPAWQAEDDIALRLGKPPWLRCGLTRKSPLVRVRRLQIRWQRQMLRLGRTKSLLSTKSNTPAISGARNSPPIDESIDRFQ